MIPKTIVEHDQSGLEEVINAMSKLSEDGFIEGIQCRNYRIDKIKVVVEDLKICQVPLSQLHSSYCLRLFAKAIILYIADFV